MRRVVIISYTEKGKELNTRVTACLLELGDVPIAFSYKENFMSTDELLRQEWKRRTSFLFVPTDFTVRIQSRKSEACLGRNFLMSSGTVGRLSIMIVRTMNIW